MTTTNDFYEGAVLPELPGSQEVPDTPAAQLEQVAAFAGDMSRQELACRLTRIAQAAAEETSGTG